MGTVHTSLTNTGSHGVSRLANENPEPLRRRFGSTTRLRPTWKQQTPTMLVSGVGVVHGAVFGRAMPLRTGQGEADALSPCIGIALTVTGVVALTHYLLRRGGRLPDFLRNDTLSPPAERIVAILPKPLSMQGRLRVMD